MNNRSIVGVDSGFVYLGYTDNGRLPEISGNVGCICNSSQASINFSCSGAFTSSDTTGIGYTNNSSWYMQKVSFAASNSSNLYNNPGLEYVVPKRILMGFYIKY